MVMVNIEGRGFSGIINGSHFFSNLLPAIFYATNLLVVPKPQV